MKFHYSTSQEVLKHLSSGTNGLDGRPGTICLPEIVCDTVYLDMDNDGYGNPEHFVGYCSYIPTGYVVDSTDCDDGNANIFPGAEEIPDNGIDENCDGVDLVTAIERLEDMSGIKVFPNPTNEMINIAYTGRAMVHFELLDTAGRMLHSGQLTLEQQGAQLDLHPFPNGIYILQLSFENGVRVCKRVIKI